MNHSARPPLAPPRVSFDLSYHDSTNAESAYGSGEILRSVYDVPHAATSSRRKPKLARSNSTFASISTIFDNGVELHTNWEYERIRYENLETQTSDLSVSSCITEGSDHRETTTTSGQTSISMSRDPVNVRTVSDNLCRAFEVSAFEGEKYLPLNQLYEIISSNVVRQLLSIELNLVEEDEVLRLEKEVFGCQLTKSPPRRRIFAILVLIGEVRRLRDFINSKIDDTALPFTFTFPDGQATMMELSNDSITHFKPRSFWGPKSASDFLIYQKVVHVPWFRLTGDEIYFYDLQPGAILPFDRDTQLTNGGYGSVRKVRINRAHHNYHHNGKEVSARVYSDFLHNS